MPVPVFIVRTTLLPCQTVILWVDASTTACRFDVTVKVEV